MANRTRLGSFYLISFNVLSLRRHLLHTQGLRNTFDTRYTANSVWD